MEIDKPPIISKLENLASEMSTYQYLQRESVFGGVDFDDKSSEHMEHMRVCALRNIGVLRPLITEITGTEKLHIISENNISFDMWHSALSPNFDKICDHAINQCLDMINITIGAVRDGVNNGKRDPNTGEKIESIQKILDTSTKPKAFIAHGGETPALIKLKSFLTALGIEPLVVEEQPSKAKSIGEKVDWYARQADFAIIFATKGDKDTKTGNFIPRGNVLIEIGKAQELFPDKTIYLLQAGTKFPSNVSEKVWCRFTPQSMDDAFTKMAQELTEFGILKAVKPKE